MGGPTNKCVKCPDECEVCDSNKGCVMCKEGYTLKSESKCVPCGGCNACNQTGYTPCTECNYNGYYGDENEEGSLICPQCPDENCMNCINSTDYKYDFLISYSAKGQICYECKDGFFALNYTGENGKPETKCVSCKGCSPCPNSLCNQKFPCDSGYYYNTDFSNTDPENMELCIPCEIENCATCTTTDKITGEVTKVKDECYACKDGFFMVLYEGKKNCSQCFVENCKTCANNVCTECEEGYYAEIMENFILSCTLCNVEFCQTCPKNVCTKCRENFYAVDEAPITECKSIYEENYSSSLTVGFAILTALLTALSLI